MPIRTTGSATYEQVMQASIDQDFAEIIRER